MRRLWESPIGRREPCAGLLWEALEVPGHSAAQRGVDSESLHDHLEHSLSAGTVLGTGAALSLQSPLTTLCEGVRVASVTDEG